MIITKLQGGHSNQLFQYALGRALAEKYNTVLKLDITWFATQPKSAKFRRQYEIDCYPLKSSLASKYDLERVGQPIAKSGIPVRILRKLGISPRFGIVTQRHLGFEKEVLKCFRNTYLQGSWQNEKYFLPIRKQLLKEFEPSTPLSKKNEKYLVAINTQECISLHVRREDYVGVQEFNDFHGLTPLEYYKKAYETICKLRRKQNLPIFVFSTDIKWCKEHLNFDTKVIYVEGNLSGSDDMRLMKHCSHNIMANSSFSWWGAWLNQNPNKIVIAPKVWFSNKKANSEFELPKQWIRL